MRTTHKISESLPVGILLAMVGGYLDIYTYINRGGVFANAQTGNIVLLGVKLAQGNYRQGAYYLAPIFAFFLGIIAAEAIKSRCRSNRLHWRQVVLAFEIAVLFAIAFIPHSADAVANILVSFVCSLQVQSFRLLQGAAYATTMCTGNLRSATEYLYSYKTTRDKAQLHHGLRLFGIIGCFILGVVLGAPLTEIMGRNAIFIACVMLAIVVALLKSERA